MPAPSAVPPHRPSSRRPGRRAAAVTTALAGLAALAPVADATTIYPSRPDLKPTTVRVTTPATNTAPGYVFTTPKGGGIDSGAMVFDNSGSPVWFQPAGKGNSILDLKPQLLDGKPVITYWEGGALRGYGFGAFKVLDQNFRVLATVSPDGKRQADFHEFTLTPQGTALLISYKPVRQSTTAVKGGKKNDLVMRNTIQEVDLKTNKVVWDWVSTDAVSPKESYLPLPARPEVAYDFIHANSVNLDSDGNVLVSARHTHTIYKIDKKTKKIVWKLGGKDSSYKMGPGAAFHWQHDAHRQPDGTISLFDNVSSVLNDKGKRSKGLVLKLDDAKRTATVARQFVNPVTKINNTQGNLQALPNGNWFVGWGGTGDNVSEFSPTGQQLFEAKYASTRTESYRAYRADWTSQPLSAPKAVARRSSRSVAVRVSWNGATTVAAWRAVGGASATSLVPRQTVPRAGFETLLRYGGPGGGDKIVAVEALDAAGNVLSRSKPVAVGTDY
ncbi:arylsulfotransferase family protein [Patulibacter minatonensis]|uniref:arylsulfotransferase family protein n=1 Tax=Patulibacter minatonensis TaxID=298163 RepID=UPI00068800E4|nr:arylsulfotransferase family protein [Patulibacter minatonensis]